MVLFLNSILVVEGETITIDLHSSLSNFVIFFNHYKGITMNTNQWVKPEATEMRWGFEITMYVANR